jgi:predicted DNA-binding protein
MSKEELAKLDYCCKKTGKSRSGIIREGIDKIYTKLYNLKEK